MGKPLGTIAGAVGLLLVMGCTDSTRYSDLSREGAHVRLLAGASATEEAPAGRLAPMPTDLGGAQFTVDEMAVTPQLPEDADLADYINYGLHRNRDLRQAFAAWRAAMQRIPQARALPDPMFQLNYFIREVQTRVGPQEAQLMLSQRFPWFGKLRLRGSVAAADAEAAWWRAQNQRLEVVKQIKQAYHEYAFLAQDLRITRENLELLKQLEPIVQRRVQGGAAQSSLLRLQVEIGKLQEEAASLREFRSVLSARLDAALHRRSGELLPWPTLQEVAPETTERQAVLDRMEASSARLEVLRREVAREQQGVASARREGYPDLTAGVMYLPTSDANQPVPDSGEDAWAVTLGGNIPLWRGKYRAGVAEAEASRDAAQARLQQKRNDLRSEAERLLYRLEDSKRRMELYQDSLLPRARQALRVSRTAYQNGKNSILDVIDSQRTLLEFEHTYWRAATDHLQARAAMEALLGGDLP